MVRNCWEIKNCCRQNPSDRDIIRGVCPAALDTTFDGINRGKNGGRICWYVAGTLCGGQKQGTFADKQLSCLSCDFYLRIKKEEGEAFRIKPAGRPNIDG
jgi:hypothetical protein